MGNKLIAGIVGPRGSHPSIYSCVLRENFIKVLKPEEILCNIRKSEEHLQVLNDIETRRELLQNCKVNTDLMKMPKNHHYGIS